MSCASPAVVSFFHVSRRWLRQGLGGAALSALAVMPLVAETEAAAEGWAVPEALREALGWKKPGAKYDRYTEEGSVFNVTSEPAKWPGAPAAAAAWLAGAPSLESDPAQHLWRRLARIEALALNATDASALADLKTERKELSAIARQLRESLGKGGAKWQVREAERIVSDLTKKLGDWLADGPADRVANFREEIESLRPPSRAALAARYGGEQKLAELVKLITEYNTLVQASQEARQNTELTAEERRVAVATAMGALGYYQGYHSENKELGRAYRDAELTAVIGEGGRNAYQRLEVPDLVELAGEAEAQTLLVEAYALPVTVSLDGTSRTGRLAIRLVLEGKLTPTRVPWSLVTWPQRGADAAGAKDLVMLYDALKAKFPALASKEDKSQDWNRTSALGRFACALAANGRAPEAVALLAAGDGGLGFPYHQPVAKPLAEAAWDLLAGTVNEKTKASTWGSLVDLMPAAGRSAELIALAAKQAGVAAANPAQTNIWRMRHGWALVADGQIDPALALLTPVFTGGLEAAGKEAEDDWRQSARRLLQLVRVLPRAELAAQLRTRLAVDFKNAKSPLWKDDSLFGEFAGQEIAAGGIAGIESLLRARLAAAQSARSGTGLLAESIQTGDTGGDDEGRNGEGRIDAEVVAMQLADVLARQGRHAEVLKLMAESFAWQSKDVAEILSRSSGAGGWRPLALVAAESLQATGRGAEAIAILEAYLYQNTGADAAYALYVKIRGQEALPFLEKLFALDRYEERPLIWKASLLLAAGNVEAAEATAKQGIAIDPSDGEQGKGDRMRAYAVLREVALKKGDATQAEFLTDVLAAIRLSEAADDVAEAGLINRAIEEYQGALDSFADAYCIQSRLARRLAEENRMDEAIEHYKRAYELMPDSFGRVESHCFGCESAFAGENAQQVAERVFTTLAERPPVKPQVFYLLGYLRKEQERWEEAAGFFSQAVAADADYLNAWKKLAEVLPRTLRPRAEQDRVAFRMVALDPAQKHGGGDLNGVRDLPGLWRAGVMMAQALPPVAKQLYPLGDKAPARKSRNTQQSYRERPTNTPAGLLETHDVLQAITNALDSVYQWETQEQ